MRRRRVVVLAGGCVSTREDGSNGVSSQVLRLDGIDVGLDELSDFFFQGHAVEQPLDEFLYVRLCGQSAGDRRPVRRVELIGSLGRTAGRCRGRPDRDRCVCPDRGWGRCRGRPGRGRHRGDY